MLSFKIMAMMASTVISGSVAATHLIPSQGLTGNGSIVLSNSNFETVDYVFAIVITFFYLVQVVRFLTIPLRTRLQETEEVRRVKRLLAMVVKAIMAAG